MEIFKYYDLKLDRPLTPEDGCSWEAWLAGAKAPFALHPDGFPVFVPAHLLDLTNEYAEGDPYAVAGHVDSAFQQRRFQETLGLLTSVLSGTGAGLRFLDLGCGEGHITNAIHRRFTDAEAFGFDYSLAAIQTARRLYGCIKFAVADAYSIPYPPVTMDATVMNNLWEHVPDPMRLLAQVHRILKPGGYVVLSTPSRYRFENMVRAFYGKPVSFMSRHHVTEYTVGQVIEQLRFGGFEIVKVQSHSIEMAGASRKWRIAKAALNRWLRLTGSHHNLEGTIFYLARKNETPVSAGRMVT